jgi:hypothetical protein
LTVIGSSSRCSRRPAETPLPSGEAIRVIDRYFGCAAKNDVPCAVGLFHYPPDETPSERREDFVAVRRSLGIIFSAFGRTSNVQAANEVVMYVEVAAGSADLSYWKAHPESLRATYKVRFGNFGDGYIAVELCQLYERWEIRSVHYGLPAQDPRSASRMLAIFNELRGGVV